MAGLLGVGGGVLFVPGLVIFLGLGQHEAEATSLLAIVPVAIVGTYRQDRYGNVRRDDALLLGLLSVAGAATGVVLANALSGTVLRDAFAGLMILGLLGIDIGPAVAGLGISARLSADNGYSQTAHVIKAGKMVTVTSSDALVVR